MPARQKLIDRLPLFASEEEISGALLVPGRAVEWRHIVPSLERRGFPSVDAIMGGRYVPAVKAFFDAEYGLTVMPPMAPDGDEDLTASWKKRDLKNLEKQTAAKAKVDPSKPQP